MWDISYNDMVLVYVIAALIAWFHYRSRFHAEFVAIFLVLLLYCFTKALKQNSPLKAFISSLLSDISRIPGGAVLRQAIED